MSNTTTVRWFGGRSSTRANNDFDAAMASVQLPVPRHDDGTRGFMTRDEARTALMKMIGDEMLEVAEYEDKFCLVRLTKILMQLVNNPTHNQGEEDGLRFAIWPVGQGRNGTAVVENFGDLLTDPQREVIEQFTSSSGSRVKMHGMTLKALVQKGILTDEGNGYGALTEKGRQAQKWLSADR